LNTKRTSLYVNLLVHLAALFPAIWLIIALALQRTGPNPVQYFEHRSGDYALILLLATLACTPARILTGYAPFTRLRRTLGLYSFAYASLHLLLYIGLDYGFLWSSLFGIIVQKPFLWFGITGFLILALLALTSTIAWQKRLKKRWQNLHSLIYIAGLLVILHFSLSLKGNIFLLRGNIMGPLIALVIYLLLLAIRLKPIRQALIRLREKPLTIQ